MSLDKEIEDSLQACREIQKYLSQNQENPEFPENPIPEPKIEPELEFKFVPESELEPELKPEPELEPEQEPEPELEHELEPEPEQKPEPEPELELEPEPEPEHELEPEPEPEPVLELEPEPERKPELEPEPETKSEPERNQHSALRTILSIVVCIFTALILSLLITKFVAHHTSVEGSSMEPTLSDGDQLIVENVSYYIDEPERFDVVVFPNKDGVNYVKRIIGLPGEEVWIFDGQIYINGELLIEDYGNELITDPGIAAGELTLGKDEYFLLGDNRNASIDSRSADVGPVKREKIKGKVWLRFFPFSKIGTIRS